MTNFATPPTYAEPFTRDEKTGKFHFAVEWLDWLLKVVDGSAAAVTDHENLSNLQGGQTGQHYHLTADEHQNVYIHSASPGVTSITLTGSPFLYQNVSGTDLDVIVRGGTVSLIEFSRDNLVFDQCGVSPGMFRLSQADYLRVTYTVPPTLKAVPR